MDAEFPYPQHMYTGGLYAPNEDKPEPASEVTVSIARLKQFYEDSECSAKDVLAAQCEIGRIVRALDFTPAAEMPVTAVWIDEMTAWNWGGAAYDRFLDGVAALYPRLFAEDALPADHKDADDAYVALDYLETLLEQTGPEMSAAFAALVKSKPTLVVVLAHGVPAPELPKTWHGFPVDVRTLPAAAPQGLVNQLAGR